MLVHQSNRCVALFVARVKQQIRLVVFVDAAHDERINHKADFVCSIVVFEKPLEKTSAACFQIKRDAMRFARLRLAAVRTLCVYFSPHKFCSSPYRVCRRRPASSAKESLSTKSRLSESSIGYLRQSGNPGLFSCARIVIAVAQSSSQRNKSLLRIKHRKSNAESDTAIF